MSTKNYDTALSKINGAISLPQYDRSTYAHDFETIRNEIIGKLRSDVLFDQLYSGTCIAGSYADNIKISAPDEYDLIVCLKLRENSKVKVTRSPNMPGYVRINMLDSLEKMKFEKQNQLYWTSFQKFSDRDGFLIQDKIQSWFEGLMTKIMKECNNSIRNGNKLYQIKYTKAGPAHTLNINGKKFSIDFVPAFVFGKQQWVAERPCPSNIGGDDTDWFAVPKPLKGQHKLNNSGPNNLNFIASYNKCERRLIAQKNNLKNTLKMLKKIRDRLNIQNLKSYFIKTIYLWENAKQSSDFWQQSTTVVLLHMFEILCESVKNGKILFFWDKGQNMLQPLDENQLKSMHGQLRKVYDDLNKYRDTNPDKIYDIFLTEQEKTKLSLNTLCNGNGNDVVDGIIKLMQNARVSANENDKSLNRVTNSNNVQKVKDNCNQGSQLSDKTNPKEEIAKKILDEIQKIMNDKKLSNIDKVEAITTECKKVDSNSQKSGIWSYFF